MSPPNVFIGGPVRVSPVVSLVEPPLKHAGMTDFGNAIHAPKAIAVIAGSPLMMARDPDAREAAKKEQADE